MNSTLLRSIGKFSLAVFFMGLSINVALAQCLGTTTTFNYADTFLQTYIVPPGIDEVRIVARGGSGGLGEGPGGYGAVVEAYVAVTPGQVLNILVGGVGGNGAGVTGARLPGGGGGGSFVWDGASNLFVAAGGAGGGGGDLNVVGTSFTGNNGGIDLTTMDPTPPINVGGAGGMTGGGGANGSGALGVGGAGGAGYNTNGSNGTGGAALSPKGGIAIVNGGAGGRGYLSGTNIGGAGGYGGGGGGGFVGGGGGGGYNGGGGGGSTNFTTTRHGGGGGGSFVIASSLPSALASVAGVYGDGLVEITCTSEVPTMGQWGVISLFLIMSIVAVVYFYSFSLARQNKR